MPSGQLGRSWTGPAVIGGHAAAAGAWHPEAGREPPLAELLDDPIMALLWRADRLDPGRGARGGACLAAGHVPAVASGIAGAAGAPASNQRRARPRRLNRQRRPAA